MIIDIHRLDPGGLRFDVPVALPELGLRGAERVRVRDARLTGEARRGRRGVEVEGRVAATLALDCSRCLEPYEVALDEPFFLILVAGAAELGVGEVRMDLEDAAFFYTEDGRVELATIAREQVYLNLPLKPLCREGCLGLCGSCGANRNRLECGCAPEGVDPRLAPLLELKRRGRS